MRLSVHTSPLNVDPVSAENDFLVKICRSPAVWASGYICIMRSPREPWLHTLVYAFSTISHRVKCGLMESTEWQTVCIHNSLHLKEYSVEEVYLPFELTNRRRRQDIFYNKANPSLLSPWSCETVETIGAAWGIPAICPTPQYVYTAPARLWENT